MLTMAEYTHNSLPVSSMGLSPFQCCLGYQPPLFSSQESDAIFPSARAFIQRCLCIGGSPEKPSLGLAKGTRCRRTVTVPSPHFTCGGQKVWLSSKDINFRLAACKLGPKFIRPFIVAKVLSPVTVRLKLTPQFNTIHLIFHVSKIKPVFRSPLQPLISAPMPPRLIERSPAYSVRRLIDVRCRGRCYQYLVD